MSTQKRFRKNKTQATEDSTVEPSPYAATFSGDDPTAWGWLNLSPFADGTDVEGAHRRESEALTRPPATPRPQPGPRPKPRPEPNPAPALNPWPEPEHPQVPVPEPEPETFPVPALAVRRRRSEAPLAAATPAWPRRRAGIASLVAVGVVVVSALSWTGRGGDGGRIRPVSEDSFAAPVQLSPATAYVRSRVLPSGDLEVTHWIRARHSVDSLTLRTPAVLGPTGTVTVSHIVLAIDGTAYPAISLDQGPPDTQTFRFPFAGAVYLRYHLSGVVEATGPDGRALARITSLNVWTDGEVASTTRTVVGARVLAMACATGPPDATPAPCGSQDGGAWTVRLDNAKQGSRVTARLDLS